MGLREHQLSKPRNSILSHETDTNNISIAEVGLPALARMELIELLASTASFALIRLRKEVGAFGLEQGDQLYVELTEPRMGCVAITATGCLERFKGQTDCFGAVKRAKSNLIF